MSGGKNPFLDDNEVDDFAFLQHHPQGESGYIFGGTSQANTDWEMRQKLLQQERNRLEERTLQSAKSSIGVLHESEQVGIATADELLRQREQLQNAERNLDSITSTMKISQKHINSMKSVFGGIKSFFNRSKDNAKSETTPEAESSQSSRLHDTIGDLKSTQKKYEDVHPGLRTRDIDYPDDDESDLGFVKTSRTGSVVSPTQANPSFDDQLDKHLEDISAGLGRLKNLGQGLQTELEDQNDIVDRLYTKVDIADESLEHQNRQIKRILKK